MAFRAHYAPLSETHPEWGKIALLGWDEAIFGFPVADLSDCAVPPPQDVLEAFCARTGARLVSARTVGCDTAAMARLTGCGFELVDFSLMARLVRLKLAALPTARFTLRAAAVEDRESIVDIAGRAFQFGRYHTDPRFPRELADRRYAVWVRNALASEDAADHVFVLGRPGEVAAFMHVVLKDGHADLRLGAVNPENSLGFAGFSLYVESLRAAAGLGARSASARISAANTAVLNVCAALGFQFSQPEAIFHWHYSKDPIQ
jgi:hypothetical protein